MREDLDPSQRGRAQRVLWIERNVDDLAAATRAYGTLGFKELTLAFPVQEAWDGMLGGFISKSRFLTLGAQCVRLTAVKPPVTPYPAESTSADLWFQHFALVTRDIRDDYRTTADGPFSAISLAGPERLPASSGGVTAFKFRDRLGHPLEWLAFPNGAEPSVWTGQPGRRAIGIDHAALSVKNADLSITFYSDFLGLFCDKRQLNKGPEQAKLDALERPEVEVVALMFENRLPPHIELLCYASPLGRRATPPLLPAHLGADRLVLKVDHFAELLGSASPESVKAKTSLGNGASAALLEDPDGHFLIITDLAAAG